jgi:pimeloyl-ACP methyl ester carboxylesterase
MIGRTKRRVACVVVCLVAIGAAACGGGGGGGGADAGPPDATTGPRDWPGAPPDWSTVPEPGVRRDRILVVGAQPPANPVDGAATPAEQNMTQILRYRQDAEVPEPARAIIVAMPGFLGGGASWDSLARALVKRGAASGVTVEVWAIDRRANLLEDLRGSEAAEAAGDPEIAWHWYFGIDTIDGEAFPGFHWQEDLTHLSEWGLATHVEDLHAVIQMVPQAERRGRVFLAGHSMGASFAEAYAAWRFEDGTRGVDELAGMILIDGVLGPTPLEETEYLEGTGGGFSNIVGLDEIRGGLPYFELPLLGISIYAGIEVMSMRMLAAPDEIVVDDVRDDALRILLSYGGGDLPLMTNEAALGWGFDDESNGLAFAAVSCGHATGGAVEPYTNPFFGGELIHPTDPDATYTWVDAFEDDPRELTPLENVAVSFTHGDTNFAEWYFPNRLSLDLAAVGGASVPEDGWHASYGLRVFDGRLIDAPILAISAGAGLVTPEEYEALRMRVAPIGANRPFEGATRDQEDAFEIVVAPGATHIDPLTASDGDANPVPAEIEAFVDTHAAAGSVLIIE